MLQVIITWYGAKLRINIIFFVSARVLFVLRFLEHEGYEGYTKYTLIDLRYLIVAGNQLLQGANRRFCGKYGIGM